MLLTREFSWEVRELNLYTEKKEMNPYFHFQRTLSHWRIVKKVYGGITKIISTKQDIQDKSFCPLNA